MYIHDALNIHVSVYDKVSSSLCRRNIQDIPTTLVKEKMVSINFKV